MAAVHVSQSTIDNLPEAERISVLDDLLNGVSGADIARRLGISRQAVSSYRQRVVKPALQTARRIQQVAPAQCVTSPSITAQESRVSNIEHVAETAALTRDIVRASPFRDRLESMWNRIDKSLDKAENAVRVTTDVDGTQRVIGQDLTPLAPLFGQAHKNLEILGKVTGELNDGPTTQIAIQIVVPAADGQHLDPRKGEATIIDVTPR